MALSGFSRARLLEIWRPNRLLLVCSAALLLGMGILTVIDIVGRYETAIRDSERFVQSFSDILAEHTARTFEAVERTLRAADSIRLATHPDDPNSNQTAREALRSLQKGSPALVALGWTDAQGNVLAHTYEGGAVRTNIADMPHFQMLRDEDQEGILVGPLFQSKATGKWISAAAIRFNDQQGNFAGVIAAPLDLSYFSRIFQSIKLGPHDSVALLGQNGKLLIREPHAEDALTMSFSATSLFTQYIHNGNRGTFESSSPIDGRTRIYGFRAVQGLPLVITVTQAKSDALAGWYEYLETQVPIRIFLMLLIVVGAFRLARQNSEFRNQNDLLQATLQNMHEGLIVVDGTDRIAMCNPKALKLLDLPAEFMTTHPSSDEVIAYQQAAGEFADVSDDAKDRIRPKVVGETENVYERHRPDGTILAIRTVPFANGGVIRTYLDVTAQRRAEDEMARNERQFRLLTEKATDIIARVDIKARLLYISPSCHRILGYAPDEMITSRILNYIHAEDLDRIKAFFAGIVAAPREWSDQRIQYRMRRKDGEWRWFEASPTPLLDSNGKVYEFVDVMRDITEHKRMEADAEAAKAQIEQAAQTKSEFLASMSHELRTPLNGIIGFAGLVLEEQSLEPDVRRKIEHIQSASDGLLSIVNDVLDLSQIDEGRLKITAVAFTLADFLDKTAAMISFTADAKGLEFRLNVEPTIAPRLTADTQRLRQILLNFLNNAVKFTKTGFVGLELKLLGEDAGVQRLRFTVSDSGIGIPRDKHERLFQRFSQVDQSIGREYGGSGLGLAICQRLVQLMGGGIGFESEPGSGSKFWVDLSLPIAAAREEPAVTQIDMAAPVGARVLLVEDLAANREIAVAILKRLDFAIDTACDGAEAIEAVKSKPYDLILMDVQMPRLDGISATKAIRTLPAPVGSTPIVAMTANVLPTQVSEFLAAGMDDHIGKPFKPAELLAAVTRNIRRPGPQPAAPEELGIPAIEELRAFMSAEEVDRLLASLAQRLRGFVVQSRSSDHATLADELHKLVSSAGLLGFGEASELFSEVEHSIRAGDDASALIAQAVATSERTLSDIRKLAAG